MVYSCNICSCNFKVRQNYERHLQTNKHKVRCENNENVHSCKNCGKSFIHKSSLSKHKLSCKSEIVSDSKIFEKTLENQRLRFEQEKMHLQNKIDKLMNHEKDERNNINNITNNIHTQNNVNIQINAFGNENLDYITEEFVLKCLEKMYSSLPSLIERIHFDPNHPENHNVKIPSKTLSHATILTDDRTWKTIDRELVIDSMVDKGYNILDETYQDKMISMSHSNQKQVNEFKEKYSGDDENLKEQIKKDVNLMVINVTGSNS